MSPVALEKAESLYRFATQRGAPLQDFQLTLSVPEGLELLDWFVGQYGENPLLIEDVADAKRSQDPFPILAHFTLMGFALVAQQALH
jgi:hypothetical protein